MFHLSAYDVQQIFFRGERIHISGKRESTNDKAVTFVQCWGRITLSPLPEAEGVV
jgi:hypothetical protein